MGALGSRSLLATAVLLPVHASTEASISVNGVVMKHVSANAHVVVVEETGSSGDFEAGLCEPHHGTLPPVKALITCTLHAAITYTNSLQGHDHGFILLAPGHYIMRSALPTIERAVTIIGADDTWNPAHAAPEVSIALEGSKGMFAPLFEHASQRPCIDGANAHQLLTVAANVRLELQGLDLWHGYGDRGGCIRQAPAGDGKLWLYNVTMHGCRAAYGGAMYTESSVELEHCRVAANRASVCGGAVYTLPNSFRAQSCTFVNNADACDRRPTGLDIMDAVTAEGAKDNTVVVGPPHALDAVEWKQEQEYMRAKDHELRAHGPITRQGRMELGRGY